MDKPALLLALAGLALAPLIGISIANAPLVAAAAVFGLTAALALFLRPVWAAWVTVGLIMFNGLGLPLGFAYLGISDLSIVVFAPIWVIYRLARPQGLVLPYRWGLMALFLLWCLVGLLVSLEPESGVGDLVRQAAEIGAMIGLVDLLCTPERLRVALILLVLAAAVNLLYALPEVGTGVRLAGLPAQPNVFARYCALGVIAGLGLLAVEPGKTTRTLLIGVLGALGVGVLLSVSRGSYGALGLTLLWWVRRNRRLAVALAAAGAATWFLLANITGGELQIEKRMVVNDDSTVNRVQVFFNGVNAIQNNPFFGVGIGQFGELDKVVEVSAQAGRGSHNFYLGLATVAGVPGLLFVLVFWGFTWRRLAWLARAASGPADPEENLRRQMIRTGQAMLIFTVLAHITMGAQHMLLWGILAIPVAAARLETARTA